MKKITKFFGANGRVLLLRALAHLHCGIIVACLCATFFAALSLTDLMEAVPLVPVYLRGVLFAVPVALSYYAAERLPQMWQFLLTVVAICLISWLLLGHIGGIAMAALVCLFRFRNRISEEDVKSSFESPSYVCLLVFAVCFSVSAVYELQLLQRLTVLSALLYLLLTLTFRAVERIESYLTLNKSMKELPIRRIVHIAGAAVAVFLAIALVLLVPSALSMSGDVVFDLPDVPGKPYKGPAEVESVVASEHMAGLDEMFGDTDSEPLFAIPPAVIYTIYALIIAAVVALIIYGVYNLFKNFRYSYADNRDIIEALPDDPDVAERTAPRREHRISALDRSPNAIIRRKYRKTVLKAAAEPPMRWKTPTEIEHDSGIAQQQLHELYEKARYGSSPCTADDVRLLKSSQK